MLVSLKMLATGASKVAQQVKALAAKLDNPSRILEPMWWKKRMNSCLLSSDSHVCAYTYNTKQVAMEEAVAGDNISVKR